MLITPIKEFRPQRRLSGILSRHAPYRRRGFALVAAFSLLAFIFILLLGLTSFVSIELRLASTRGELSLARQNALLALNVALAELQQNSGPDQRVTVTSATLDSNPATAELEGVTYPNWTGVWNSNGELITWLVSGNEHSSPAESTFLTPASTISNAVPMYSDSSVQVPLVSLDSKNAYAFWVADEGVKAKATLSAVGNATYPLLTPTKVDVSQMSELEWMTDIEQAELQKIIDLQTLSVFASNLSQEASLNNYFQDVTVNSYGHLTDTLNGGLKQDLTLALFDNLNTPTGQIFPPLSGSQSFQDPGGPLWNQLKSWANSGALGIKENGNLSARSATDIQTGISPVITLIQFYVVPRYKLNTGTQKYSVFLEIFPALVLWNPYDRPLEIDNGKIDIARNFWDRTHSTPVFNYYFSTFYGWQIEIDGIGTYNNFTDPRFPSNLSFSAGMHFEIGNVVLAPGESVAFSPPYGDTSAEENQMEMRYSNYQYYSLLPGYRPTACYSIPTDIEAGYDPGDPTSTEYNFTLRAHTSISESVRLRDGDQILQQVFWLGGLNQPSASETQIQPLGSATMEGSVGLKAIMNFTEIIGESGEDRSIKWLTHQNPRASTQGANPLHLYASNQSTIQAKHLINPSFYSSSEIDGFDRDFGLINIGNGLSVDSAYIDSTILFETPENRSTLQSIGQLMHAPLYYSHADTSRSNVSLNANRTDTGNRLQWGRYDNFLPAYSVGNSEADPKIALDSLYVDWDEDEYLSGFPRTYALVEGRHYDYSHFLNEALWDKYYFSTLTAPTSRETANTRLVPLDPTETSPLSSLNAASELIIDGAFNVNSTSEEAWRAVLAAFFGEAVEDKSTDASPYLRIHNNPGDLFNSDTEDADSSSAYHGYRSLDREQIANLARQIVKENKWRSLGRGHPYTSLSDFVNRDPASDAPTDLDSDAFRLRGALSAAIREADNLSTAEANELEIDGTKARINTSLSENAYATAPRTEAGFEELPQEGWRTESLPGWLTQADILARIGSIITVRSDTFKIRVYGENTNPFNGSKSQAWGEAIVQRLPDYVDPESDSPDTPLTSLTGQENITFGRRYVIVSFQWLNAL